MVHNFVFVLRYFIWFTTYVNNSATRSHDQQLVGATLETDPRNVMQLDVCNLSLGRRHLLNAYKVKAGIGVLAGNTVIDAGAPRV